MRHDRRCGGKGQKVAETGSAAVYAEMTGIVRGMLQPGVRVTKGLKIGDIDARQCREYCESISDKARSTRRRRAGGSDKV